MTIPLQSHPASELPFPVHSALQPTAAEESKHHYDSPPTPAPSQRLSVSEFLGSRGKLPYISCGVHATPGSVMHCLGANSEEPIRQLSFRLRAYEIVSESGRGSTKRAPSASQAGYALNQDSRCANHAYADRTLRCNLAQVATPICSWRGLWGQKKLTADIRGLSATKVDFAPQIISSLPIAHQSTCSSYPGVVTQLTLWAFTTSSPTVSTRWTS